MWYGTHGLVSALLAASMSISGTARATDEHAAVRRLSLRVSAQRDVPTVILQRAQREVVWIFEEAGVQVEWIGCGLEGRPPDSHTSTSAAAINVVIISRETKALSPIPPDVLGAVMRDNDAREVGWVFFRRIEHASEAYALNSGVVLGHAIAHEVGHLLLPRGTHGSSGLMRASWRMDDMRDAGQNHLRFSPAEAAIIRARLAARNALNPD
ncbi:MAG TPA: hypothetical protein VF456_11100 [Vicinamibacterales bacterium]